MLVGVLDLLFIKMVFRKILRQFQACVRYFVNPTNKNP